MEANKKISYSSLLEAAFVIIIGQNALLASKPVVSFLSNNLGFLDFIIFILIAIINTLNIVANWISSKKTEGYYTAKLFFWDIITLAVFSVFTQIVTDCFIENILLFSIKKVIFIFALSYIIIYLMYAIWNVENYKLLIGDAHERGIMVDAIIRNIFVLVILTTVLFGCLIASPMMYVALFFAGVSSLFYVLIRYFGLLFQQNKHNYKMKAIWLGDKKRIFSQIVTSIFSYAIRPFVLPKKGATERYFSKVYNNIMKDSLIFDGSNSGYYSKLEPILKNIDLQDKTIIDFCCGKGTLLHWLTYNVKPYNKYIGVDLACDSKRITNNARMERKDVLSYKVNNLEESILFIINGLCYLSNNEYRMLIKNVCDINDIFIIEPIPSLFWDACFDRIILHYRKKHSLEKMFKRHGFFLQSYVTDYAIKIGECYFCPLSCAYHFKKQ